MILAVPYDTWARSERRRRVGVRGLLLNPVPLSTGGLGCA